MSTQVVKTPTEIRPGSTRAKTGYFDMLNTSTEAASTLHTTLKSAPVMKSVRFHGPGDIRLDTVEEPVCGKGQVKVGFEAEDFPFRPLT